MKTEAKVGVFVFLGIAFLFFMTTQVNDLNVATKKDFKINAEVSNIAGLEKNAKVKINGLDVGFVKGFELVGDKVKINMVLKNRVDIPVDSTVTLASSSMLSGKFVEIALGKDHNYIQQQESLKNELIYSSFDQTSDSIDQAAQEVKLFIQELRSTLDSGTREDIQASISNIKSFTERLDKIVKNNEGVFEETLHNFNEMAIDLSEAGKSFGDMSNRFSGTADTINDRLPNILDKFETIENNVDNLVKNIDSVVDDNKASLKTAISSASKFFDEGGDAFNKIDDYFASVHMSQLELGLRSEMMANDGYMKNYMSIKYATNPTKFYLLEVASTDDYSMKNGTVNNPALHESGKYLISAQFGKRFRDIVFRGGLIEGTGGMALDYYTYHDRLRATIELYDFNAVNDARGDNLHAKFSLRYNMLKYLDLYAGYDNFLNNESANIYAGVGIRFVDDDFKTLIGSVGGSLIK
jgi:phospholipid/cholesterol/gamma-HCH transport system substrate-binding protein